MSESINANSSSVSTPTFSPVDWWQKNKRWIFPTVWFIVGYLGGNPDNIQKWLPEVPGNNTEIISRLDKLDSNLETLAKIVGEHDKLLSQTKSDEKPVFRE